jgi:hypothetical protein
MIHKGDVPSVQCEINFGCSKCTREADGPARLILIEFNVPALAPRLS